MNCLPSNMSSTNNFTDVHIRDFIEEVRRDPTRPGYDSALQLHADVNVPPVQGEELSDDVDFLPIPTLIRYFAPGGQVDLYQPTIFVYARGQFRMSNSQDGLPQILVNAFAADW